MNTAQMTDHVQFDQLAACAPGAILVLNQGLHILFANEAATHALHTSADELCQLTLSTLDQDNSTLEHLTRLVQLSQSSNEAQHSRTALMSGSGLVFYQVSVNAQGAHIYLFLQNISSLVQLERTSREQTTDPLTGLLNRQQLFTMGAQDLARSKRYNTPVSLLVVNIANIRYINQTYGYNIGDHVLVSIAKILQGMLRESDYVARLDDKSFVISLIGATLEQVDLVADRVRKAVDSMDVVVADTSIPVLILCGGAQYDSLQDHHFDDLLLRAENQGHD